MANSILSSSRQLKRIYQKINVHKYKVKLLAPLCETLQIETNLQQHSLLNSILNEWRYFCEKPPKGFEKYFKPEGNKTGVKENKTEKPEIKAKDKDGKSEQKVKPKPSTSTTSGPQGNKPYDQWGFGLFGGTGNRYYMKWDLRFLIIRV